MDSEAALVYLANQAVVTFHLYLSRTGDLRHPDKMIFDLGPPGDTEDFSGVREAATDLRRLLRELELDTWIQTTGSKGFHLWVPLDRSSEFDRVHKFARNLAEILASRHPDKVTTEVRKEKRRGRIFLDTMRNAYSAAAVAPYSVRARPGAPVATPIDWEELYRGASPRDWTMGNLPQRMGQKEDPWKNMQRHAFDLGSRGESLQKLLDSAGLA